MNASGKTRQRQLVSRIPAETGRVFRFAIVGVLATATYLFVSLMMVEAIGLSPVLASIIGQSCAMGVSYFGHAFYSFKVGKVEWVYFWRFLLVAAATFSLNIGLTWLFTERAHLPYWFSFLIVAVLIPLVNYLSNRFWVFLPGIQSESKYNQ